MPAASRVSRGEFYCSVFRYADDMSCHHHVSFANDVKIMAQINITGMTMDIQRAITLARRLDMPLKVNERCLRTESTEAAVIAGGMEHSWQK